MDISIRLAKKSDLLAYTDLLLKTYQEAYVNEKLGLTIDCFSEDIFKNKNTQEYLITNLIVNKSQKCWLAFDKQKLVGAVSIIKQEKDFELRGFYVAPDYQGKGIGKKLWYNALSFAGNKDIVLDTYSHNKKTINIYKKWGFKVDKAKGIFYRHWPEWPEGLRAKCIYMIYKQI